MSALYVKISKWWLALASEERQSMSLIFFVILVYVIHYLVFCIPQPFFIEDSAISFAYARNAAMGDGFVTYPGGERVEGFSNALWTFLITAGYFIGIPVWTSAKVMGAIFGVLTLPYVFGLTKKMGIPQRAAVIAPAMLAISPQFAIWNASGLENSLYVFCMSGGMWHLLEEAGDPKKRPWSALFFCGLAMTRPEGIMYVAVAAFSRLIFAIVDRRLSGFVLWLLTFSIPFVLFHAWRMWYFAWPFPNTYYAKLGAGKAFKPFGWSIKGWKYILGYLDKHYLAYALPLFGFALVGTRGWRVKAYLGFICWLLFVILWDGKWADGPDVWKTISSKWIEIRVFSILAVAVFTGLMNLGRKGWRARSLLWATGASSVFFVVYSGGDWMKAHRWFNVVEVPLIPILFAGLWALIERIPNRFKVKLFLPTRTKMRQVGLPVWGVLLAVPLVGYAAAEVNVSYKFSRSPETSVNDVHRRVKYMTYVQNRLDLDHVTLLDVDMGAHVYFSGWDIVDIAGLVDVPIARHSDYNHKFMSEYIFKERKPDFAHVHGGWARTSRIPKHNEWKKEYLEIPGYPVGGRRLHIGNHVRKDIFIQRVENEKYPDAHAFAGGILLLDHDVPSPRIAPGGWLFVQTFWRATEKRDADVQALFLLVDGNEEVVASASLAPGYRWYAMSEWKTNERVEGKFRIAVSEAVATGTYALKVMVLDNGSGMVLPPQTNPDATGLDASVYLGDVEIVQVADAMDAAESLRTTSVDSAEEGRCEEAWRHWKNATRHVGRNKAYANKHDASIRTAIGACYFQLAQQISDTKEQLDYLEMAYFWDHRLDGWAETAHPLAEEWTQKGEAAMKEEDWDLAYNAYSQALRLNPSLSWARRYAEDARDQRLNIVRPYDKEDSTGSKTPSRTAPKRPLKKLDRKIKPEIVK